MQLLVPKYIYKEAAHNINVGRFTLSIKKCYRWIFFYEPEKLTEENGTNNAFMRMILFQQKS